jgi:hypothetical protein
MSGVMHIIDDTTLPGVARPAKKSDFGGGGGSGSGAGVIPGVDANGTSWVMIVNSTTTPPTITYALQSTGAIGTPVGGFTPDADQNGLTDTQLRAAAVPVSVASLPLAPGASTSALQTAANASLANIDADLGAQADAAATSDTGTFSLIALKKRGLQNWSALLDRIPALVSGRMPVDGSGVTQPTKDVNGAGAVRYTTDTTAVTGSYAQIMCVQATTFSVLTRTGATGSLVGIPIPAGVLLIGPFTAYTLTSGVVAAYA